MFHLNTPHRFISNAKNTVRFHRYKSSGFTIVELLIVIVVIGVLAAISVIAYSGINERAKDAANDSNTTNILKVAETHRSAEGIYPYVVSIWLGRDDHGNEQVAYRLGTTVSYVDGAIYRNPAAPDWAGSTMILNVNPNVGGSGLPFDTWSETAVMPVPNAIPGGYQSWAEFYDALNSATAAWMTQYPLPSPGASQDEMEQYTQAFLASYPQFACAMSFEGCNEEQSMELRDIKKEWMYFLDPLVRPEDAAEPLCINSAIHYAKITGFSLRYYSQSQDGWLSKTTGSGVVGNFQTCPM